MLKIGISEARERLPELLHQAVTGGDVVITGEDGAAVRLVPVAPSGQPRFGSGRGLFTMADDFDAPLEDFAPYEA